MKITTVKMVFKGNETINEVYSLYVKELRDVILMLDPNDVKALLSKRLEIMELLAIVDNKLAFGRGYQLTSSAE